MARSAFGEKVASTTRQAANALRGGRRGYVGSRRPPVPDSVYGGGGIDDLPHPLT